MKILHLMREEKFTQGIAEFYDSHFNNGEHEICYVTKKGSTQINHSLSIKQFEFYSNCFRSKTFYRFIKKYDWIIIHSIFFGTKVKLAFILNKLLKKIIWIEWGFDLYNSDSKKGFSNRVIDTYFKTHLFEIVCIFEPDINYYRKIFPKSKVKIVYAPYIYSQTPPDLLRYSNESRLKITIKNNDPFYIQVGHQSNKQIDHIKTLTRLLKFKENNIKIVLPLSYGDKNNALRVKKFAMENFKKDKIIVLEDFLPKDDYVKILNRIDIAIFETQRQIGLGNINRLVFKNTKLFLTKDSIMYNYFINNGVPVESADDIDFMSFDDFIKPKQSKNADKFLSFVNRLSDYSWKLQLWQNIFASLEDNK